jgi:hypothetical protein
MVAYGQPAPFRPEVEELVIRKVDALVSRVRSTR